MSRKNNGSMKQIGSSHRGRRGKIKDNPNPETSDGEKTSILSMNISDIGKALRASSSKTSKKADLPAEWNVRANLLPSSIVTLNRDRAIKYLLSYVLIVVVVAAIAISDIPALAISTAPPNANSPVALDESAGPIAPAIASSAAIPPIMIVIPANAIGPAAAS